MADNALSSELRTSVGKGAARKLRANGRIPAVVYAPGKGGASVSIDPKALERVLHQSGSGMNTLIALEVDGSARTVLLKELQRDPVRGRYLHADFYELDLTQRIKVSVPVHFVGKARGVELGGILDHPLREVEVQCLPRDIPDSLEIDVSGLAIGESLHVRDLVLPAGVEVLDDPNLSIANVMTPTAEEPTAAEAAAAAGEAPAEAAAGGAEGGEEGGGG